MRKTWTGRTAVEKGGSKTSLARAFALAAPRYGRRLRSPWRRRARDRGLRLPPARGAPPGSDGLPEHRPSMNLAGFCRNCLSKWYLKGARVQGTHMTYDEALEIVYGGPYGDWKKKHQSKATDEQMAAFEGNKHLPPAAGRPPRSSRTPARGAAPAPKPSPTVLSDVCCTPADECAPPGAAASAAAPGRSPAARSPSDSASSPSAIRASNGEYADESGPAVFAEVAAWRRKTRSCS